MSTIASFYLFPKKQVTKFCELLPVTKKLDQSSLKLVRFVSPEEMQRKTSDASRSLFDKYKKEICDYNWAGWVMSFVFMYLKQTQNVDLTDSKIEADFDMYVLDEDTQIKYLQLLEPSKFNEKDLKDWMSKMPEDFPEAGSALLDGVRTLYTALKEVDSKTVLLIKIS